MKAKIFNTLEKHFKDSNENVNNSQLHNATSTVYMFLKDEDLLLKILVNTLYPTKGENHERKNEVFG